jgi:hypothetical protein
MANASKRSKKYREDNDGEEGTWKRRNEPNEKKVRKEKYDDVCPVCEQKECICNLIT